MVQLKMRINNKAIPWSKPKQRKLQN